MGVYEYKAFDKKGKEINGIIEAESRVAAAMAVKRLNLYPVTLQETTGKSIEKRRGEYSLSSFFDRIHRTDIAMFTTQFAALVEAGMPVVNSFDIVIQQTEKKSVKKMLSVIKEEVNKGVSLADAFSLFPRHFPSLFVNMVRAGEESGSLEIVLKRLADYLQNQLEMRSKIAATLAYPLLMLAVGTGVVFFLVTFVIPTVSGIFKEMDQALPLPTMLLLAVSGFFKSSWPFLLIGVIILLFFLSRYKKTTKGRYLFDRLKLRLPLIGTQYRKVVMARFTRTLGTLLTNGVPIVTSFDIVKNIIDNTVISAEIERVRDEIHEGKEIAGPLGSSGIFPPVVVNMIAVGEKSGQLEEMLNRASRIMENELESSLKKLLSLLEPVMILVMAFIVGFIVISILLPIFEINQLIK
ncbi:MAG: type II secretion system inner membrane protein GspF [Deltaproteobacteria bacterium]|nr:type II secretion system inner membrane protein GspF [Deltaproteobacteria bacterium]